MKTKEEELSDNQKIVLKEFILYFLPKRGNKRKNTNNEIASITDRLDKLFNKNFDFRLSRQNILDAFEELGYDIYTRNAIYDSENKKHKPSAKSDIIRFGDVYSKYKAGYIYIDINAPIIKLLALSVYKSVDTKMNNEKIESLINMNEKLRLFKQTINHLL